MHCHAEQKAELFRHSYCTPDTSVDSMLAKNGSELEKQNREILWQIVFAVEFL